jgi:hypothetical protein
MLEDYPKFEFSSWYIPTYIRLSFTTGVYELPLTPNEGRGFRTLSALGFEEFPYGRFWYICSEDLLPTKEAWPETIHFRLQDATEVELAKMDFVAKIKA